MRLANSAQTCGSRGRTRLYFSSEVLISALNVASVYGRRPMAMSMNSWGRRFVRQSWYRAGMTLR